MSRLLLEKGLAALGLSTPVDPLMTYIDLLAKWNKAYNLTSIVDPDGMVKRHLLDSLAIVPFIEGDKILDVGTGAGLPGLPLAIHFPMKQFVLVDSNGKKIRFLREVKRVLGLRNVEIMESRVEKYEPGFQFDTIVSRALTDLATFESITKQLVHAQSVRVAMKGHYPTVELAMITCAYVVKSYKVPGLEEERTCVLMRNSDDKNNRHCQSERGRG